MSLEVDIKSSEMLENAVSSTLTDRGLQLLLKAYDAQESFVRFTSAGRATALLQAIPAMIQYQILSPRS